jgi:excisionase family DNA binding protein
MATPNEAAKMLGVSRPTVMRWIKGGKLRGEKRNSGWFVDEDSVNSLLQPVEHVDEHVDEQYMNEDSSDEVVGLKLKVAELNATLAGKDELISQLKSDLEYERRPFWRKWLDR